MICLYNIERNLKKSLKDLLLEVKYYENRGFIFPYSSRELKEAIDLVYDGYKGFNNYSLKEPPSEIFKACSSFLCEIKSNESFGDKVKRVLYVNFLRVCDLFGIYK